jgi:hypothetical protein
VCEKCEVYKKLIVVETNGDKDGYQEQHPTDESKLFQENYCEDDFHSIIVME